MNHCGVVCALEIVVAGGENYRRVLGIHVAEEAGKVGLITWVLELSWPFGQTHSNERALGLSRRLLPIGVADAEGLEG